MNDLEPIINACATLLETYPAAESVRRYLSARASEEAVKTFGFGYFPNHENINALTSLVGDEALYKNKLQYDRLDIEGVYRKVKTVTFEHHNLVLPYRDAYGKTVAMVGRTLLSEKEMAEKKVSKYRNTSFEKKSHVFGLDTARAAMLEHDCCFVVEGQFDCIAAQQRGIKNVVAIGSANLSMYQLSLMMRYTNNIYLFLDNDDAGIAGTKRIIDRFGTYANIKAKTVALGYKDLDEYLKDFPETTCNDLIRL